MKFFLTRQVRDLENISQLENDSHTHEPSVIDHSQLFESLCKSNEISKLKPSKPWEVVYGQPLSKRRLQTPQNASSSMNVSRISSCASQSFTASHCESRSDRKIDKTKQREASWRPVINKPTCVNLTLPLPEPRPCLNLQPFERKRPRMKPLLDCRR